ncbi:histone acetylation protein 2 [Biscogniauxia marginata]|nr:histone acetylation protein 2 [Biscogniauxia marginata]
MPSSAQSQHARSHALLLLQKLLNLRDSASPLTLVLDTLEQSAKPVVREFVSRAKVSKSKVIFVSFATLRKPADADIFVRARGKTPEALRAEITSHYPSGAAGHAHKVLVLLDALNALCAAAPSSLPLFLSSLVVSPAVSLVAVYHTDVPLPPSSSSSSSRARYYDDDDDEYAPHPLATLGHLATAVLRVASLRQEAARRRARDRSLEEPGFGLGEGREGVLVGLKGGDDGNGGGGGKAKDRVGGGVGGGGGGREKEDGGPEDLVLEMELRRRSGRAVAEKFVLVPPPPAPTYATNNHPRKIIEGARISLLSEHPAFTRGPGELDPAAGAGGGDGGDGRDGREVVETGAETTFSLGLTEKQRRDREGIVLPYFDAQTDVGAAGEGGRILYEMGREDDFDEEEDEI